MKPLFKRIVLAASVAAVLGATTVTPALADRRYHRHNDYTGAYIGLGLGALALGALAYSASQPAYYYAPPAYYYPPPAPQPYPGYPYYSYRAAAGLHVQSVRQYLCAVGPAVRPAEQLNTEKYL